MERSVRVQVPLTAPEIIPSIDKKSFIGGWFYFALKMLKQAVPKLLRSGFLLFWGRLFLR